MDEEREPPVRRDLSIRGKLKRIVKPYSKSKRGGTVLRSHLDITTLLTAALVGVNTTYNLANPYRVYPTIHRQVTHVILRYHT